MLASAGIEIAQESIFQDSQKVFKSHLSVIADAVEESSSREYIDGQYNCRDFSMHLWDMLIAKKVPSNLFKETIYLANGEKFPGHLAVVLRKEEFKDDVLMIAIYNSLKTERLIIEPQNSRKLMRWEDYPKYMYDVLTKTTEQLPVKIEMSVVNFDFSYTEKFTYYYRDNGEVDTDES